MFAFSEVVTRTISPAMGVLLQYGQTCTTSKTSTVRIHSPREDTFSPTWHMYHITSQRQDHAMSKERHKINFSLDVSPLQTFGLFGFSFIHFRFDFHHFPLPVRKIKSCSMKDVRHMKTCDVASSQVFSSSTLVPFRSPTFRATLFSICEVYDLYMLCHRMQ